MSRFHNRNFELLEPYEGKLSRTVLRGESSRKGADLLDRSSKVSANIQIFPGIETVSAGIVAKFFIYYVK